MFNGVLASINFADGMVSYHTPMTTGCSKSFSTSYHSFWCCTGTCAEELSKLGESIYFHDNNSVYVNLFISSRLNWKEKAIAVEQLTSLDDSQKTTFTIRSENASRFGLNIRIPYWATKGFSLKVNGRTQNMKSPLSSYLKLERQWRSGDTVELAFPLALHADKFKNDTDKAALMYGPVVLAAAVQKDQFIKAMPSGNVSAAPVGSPLDDWYLIVDSNSIETWLKPVKNQPMVFQTAGVNRNLTFKPFYDFKGGESYGVYWLLLDSSSARYKKLLEKNKSLADRDKVRVIDRVIPGDANSESVHNLFGNSTIGYQSGRAWREGNSAWGWELAVLPDAPMTLACNYFNGDNYSRNFEIFVDGQKIAAIPVPIKPPCEFVETEIPLQLELTKGKQKVKVEFRPVAKGVAGSIYGLAMLKPADYARNGKPEDKTIITSAKTAQALAADANTQPDVCRNPQQGKANQ
jgi:hypothetical protein